MMEHVDPRQQKPLQPLGQDRLRCDWERISVIAREVAPLARRQCAEMVAQPFDMDWDRLFDYERAGTFAVWTARLLDRTLVGYAACLWSTGLWSQSTRFCRVEAFYLVPEWRGPLGYRYMKSLLAAIERLAPDATIEWETNDRFQPDEHGRSRLAKLLERLNFRQVGTTFQR